MIRLLPSFLCRLFRFFNSKIIYHFLIPVTIMVSSDATSQVTADFTTNSSTTGCGSLVVSFQDLSTGNPTTWLWDFGNGNTSSSQNPIAVYSNAGIYNVSLTVGDNITTDSKFANGFVSIYENPSAGISSSFSSIGCAPLSINFNDASNSIAGVTNWQWDFGDGGSSTLQNPNYEFLNSGTFSVTLIVTDANGSDNMIIDQNMIQISDAP